MSFGIPILAQKLQKMNVQALWSLQSLLENSNYLAWASSIELWCKGQHVQDHITNNAEVLHETVKSNEEHGKVKAQWKKIDTCVIF